MLRFAKQVHPNWISRFRNRNHLFQFYSITEEKQQQQQQEQQQQKQQQQQLKPHKQQQQLHKQQPPQPQPKQQHFRGAPLLATGQSEQSEEKRTVYQRPLNLLDPAHTRRNTTLVSHVFAPQTGVPQQEHEGVASYRLLVRAGYIHQVSQGIFNYLPLGLRVLDKIVAIVDRELRRIGCQKLAMPVLLPRPLWETTGRWHLFQEQLFRLQDQRSHHYCLAPTHEEVVTSLVQQTIDLSPRYCPLKLYQIGTKFRDEIQPRNGLLRAKEFIMKDLYTFDRTVEEAHHTYVQVRDAYRRIFSQMGLDYAVVDADSGSIGGNMSQEFQVLASVGEDTLITCQCGQYVANAERAIGSTIETMDIDCAELEAATQTEHSAHNIQTTQNDTTNTTTTLAMNYDSLLDSLRSLIETRSCTMVLLSMLPKDAPSDMPMKHVLAIVPADRKVNDVKIKSLANGSGDAHVKELTYGEDLMDILVSSHCSECYVDSLLHKEFNDWNNNERAKSNNVNDSNTGSNEMDNKSVSLFLRNIRIAQKGDVCIMGNSDSTPCCVKGSPLSEQKGIEVGHVFYLGTKYSKQLEANYRNANGEIVPFEMGCFGIGVSRVLQAIVQTNHDQGGIVWPSSVAPFKVCLVPLPFAKPESMSAEEYKKAKLGHYVPAEQLAETLQEQIPLLDDEVILDDRMSGISIWAKLDQASLMGYPYVIVVGKSYVKNQKFEVIVRRTLQVQYLTSDEVVLFLREEMKQGYLV